jgi:hypothetical protein
VIDSALLSYSALQQLARWLIEVLSEPILRCQALCGTLWNVQVTFTKLRTTRERWPAPAHPAQTIEAAAL